MKHRFLEESSAPSAPSTTGDPGAVAVLWLGPLQLLWLAHTCTTDHDSFSPPSFCSASLWASIFFGVLQRAHGDNLLCRLFYAIQEYMTYIQEHTRLFKLYSCAMYWHHCISYISQIEERRSTSCDMGAPQLHTHRHLVSYWPTVGIWIFIYTYMNSNIWIGFQDISRLYWSC